MRVALLSYRSKPHSGGQGVYVENLSRGLVEAGHDVEVFSGQPYPDLDPRVRLTKVPSLGIYDEPNPFVPPPPWRLRSLADAVEYALTLTGAFGEPLSFTLRMERVLRGRAADFDVVHDNQSLGYGLLAIRRRMPLVATVHHPISRDRTVELDAAKGWRRLSVARWYSFVPMQARVARRIPFVVGVSTVATDDAVTDFGIDPDRIRVVPLGVDTTTFRPREDGHRVPGRIVAVASADKPLKGLAHLLDALAKLRVERDVELQLVSSIEPGGPTDRRIDALGLRDCITVHRGVGNDELAELLASADVMCVPSLYEGFGLPIVEAFALGVPVITSARSSTQEVAGDAALLIDPESEASIAEALLRAGSDPELRRDLAARGRARAAAYRWTAMGEGVLRVVARIAQERAGPGVDLSAMH